MERDVVDAVCFDLADLVNRGGVAQERSWVDLFLPCPVLAKTDPLEAQLPESGTRSPRMFSGSPRK